MGGVATADEALELADWRRRVAGVYAEVRAAGVGKAGWDRWRAARDELFASHPQSPLAAEARRGWRGLRYFDHDPRWRAVATVTALPPERVVMEASAGETMAMTRVGAARFSLLDTPCELEVFWLDGYAGGVFVSFRDETSGDETYGACRYLLDTAKGADLGGDGATLVLDFNFAYQPSCSYDPRWVCPLTRSQNGLALPVRAGERLAG